MLRIEKSKKDCQINVCLREPAPFCSRLFLQAFAIALALHLGAFILFRIQPFKADSNFIFPPIQVVSQAPFAASHVTVDGPEEDILSFPIALFKPTSLLPTFTTEMPLIADHSFTILENRTHPIPHHSLPVTSSYFPLQIHVSGQLAKRKLLAGANLQPVQTQKEKATTYHIVYDVQIDNQSGHIFWHNKTLSSQKSEIDQEVEKKLLDLRFETSKSFEGVTGQIDFYVTTYD